MTHDSPTTSPSRHKIIQAAVKLLDTHEPNEISITLATKEAGVTRPTFYASFPDLASLFSAAALWRIQDSLHDIQALLPEDASPHDQMKAMHKAILTIVERMITHRVFFTRVLASSGAALFTAEATDYFAYRITHISPLSPQLEKGTLPIELSSHAIAAGCMWLMAHWLRTNTDLSPAHAARTLTDYIYSSIVGGLSTPAKEL